MILQGKEDAGLDPALSGEIQGLSEGEVSGVVRSDFGYHLIKVIEKGPATYKNYKEVAREIRSKLEEEKRIQSVAEIQKELWGKSQVTIKEPIVPAITHADSGDEKKGSQMDSPHLVSQTGAQGEEEDPAPEIRLMAEAYDLGTISPERQTRSILIKNSGKADLLIKAVRTACPCTLAEIQPNKLRPGESGILTVTFDPSLYEGKGVLTQTIMIESNDPNHPKISVSLQAVVSSRLEVSAKQG
jgi:hypothetical protein